MQEPGPEQKCPCVQAQATVLLLLAAALHSASANSEKGESPETCYNTQLSSTTATVVYTKSGSPRDTTFTFLVQHPPNPHVISTHSKNHVQYSRITHWKYMTRSLFTGRYSLGAQTELQHVSVRGHIDRGGQFSVHDAGAA